MATSAQVHLLVKKFHINLERIGYEIPTSKNLCM